jgi:hypothetical protein
VWRRDGEELFFMAPDYYIYSVDLSKLASARTVPPSTKLFRACPQTIPAAAVGAHTPWMYPFDTLDGNRFLINCRAIPPGQFGVLINSIFTSR